MAGLSGRVRRLERETGGRGHCCPGCGGRGAPAFQVRLDGVDQCPARGCGSCGRIGVLNVLCIDEPETEMEMQTRPMAGAASGSAGAWTPRPGEGR